METELDYSMIPAHCRESVRAYVEDGCPGGRFLQAVFENNLVEAFSQADDTNIERMFDYCRFLYSQAPIGSWRGTENVAAWIKKGGLRERGKNA